MPQPQRKHNTSVAPIGWPPPCSANGCHKKRLSVHSTARAAMGSWHLLVLTEATDVRVCGDGLVLQPLRSLERRRLQGFLLAARGIQAPHWTEHLKGSRSFPVSQTLNISALSLRGLGDLLPNLDDQLGAGERLVGPSPVNQSRLERTGLAGAGGPNFLGHGGAIGLLDGDLGGGEGGPTRWARGFLGKAPPGVGGHVEGLQEAISHPTGLLVTKEFVLSLLWRRAGNTP